MHSPPLILAVDDIPANLEILQMRLESQGYRVATAVDGAEALDKVRALRPDLILLDVMMPKLDGIEVTRRIKADSALPFMPIILVTAKSDSKDVVSGLDSGGDDYLVKPFDHGALSARVRSMLRIKALHDTVQEQSKRLETQAAELAAWNQTLEARVAAQVAEIERVGRLKRFLAPQVADMILSAGNERILNSHRRDIVVLFCDMRGFTAFAEVAEPEDVTTLLAEFHGALGPLVRAAEGTLDRFTGDGLMAFFNDPLPCPDAPARAVRLAVRMREGMTDVARSWQKRGHQIGFGVGIAQGYATLGQIGFEDRSDYTAIGTVTNLAARLCGEAANGQILITQRIAAAAEAFAELEPVGELTLKGISRPTPAHNVVALRA